MHDIPTFPIRYSFANEWHAARERLAAIETWLDPGTIRHLLACGVGEGWQCLEVAAGGGSIAAWLSHQVGSLGQVVATDINPRFLEELDLPNLEVRRHHLLQDALQERCLRAKVSRRFVNGLQSTTYLAQIIHEPGGGVGTDAG